MPVVAEGADCPIIVTEDNVVVAGHQRMRGLRDIGETQIAAIVRHFDSEDEIERALIDSNTSQRGTLHCSDLKLSKLIRAKERIYGIANNVGNNAGRSPTPLSATRFHVTVHTRQTDGALPVKRPNTYRQRNHVIFPEEG